jgi:adenosine deaminase
MTTVADFIKVPKQDAHNHLEYGMRYQSYAPWAGYYIPDFPVSGIQSEQQLIAAVDPYMRARIRTEKDILDTMNLSLMDAVGDGVTSLEGTIDSGLIQNCQNIEHFTALIQRVQEKYRDRVAFHPVLGINCGLSLRSAEKSLFQLLRTGIFTGIDVYGPSPALSTALKTLFKVAANFGLTRKIHAEQETSADGLRQLVDQFHPDEIVQGICAAEDDALLQQLAAENIRISLCPRQLVQTGIYPDYRSIPLRKFAGAHVPFALCTSSLLLFHKSISEQCVELCNAGLFTKEELTALISSTPSKA